MSVDDKAINFLEEVKKLDWGVRIYRWPQIFVLISH
jgi:hypothetical protein